MSLVLVAITLLVLCEAQEVKRRVGLRYIVGDDSSSVRYGSAPMMSDEQTFKPQRWLRGRYGKRSQLSLQDSLPALYEANLS
ncbi:hypothetical protein Q1695_000571 [Nippostrongylus brasiliensis]|nr:hypothetical protein Q1695_000571 [Nippostrongylus brasiliensis]